MFKEIKKDTVIKGNPIFDMDKPLNIELLNEEYMESFKIGYRDAINAKLDSRDYCRVNKVEFYEEYLYLEGYRIGYCDYNLEVCDDSKITIDTEYLNTIKISLTMSKFKDALADIITCVE